eukprot:SAG31_NODE_713_length_12651_cov_180.009481_3_plen_108_part_00
MGLIEKYGTNRESVTPQGVDLNSGGFQRRQNPSECRKCPINMSGYAYEHLPLALEEGLITVRQLKIAATRTLRLRFELGLFDPPDSSPFARFGVQTPADASHQVYPN